jgi:hypothetical protein
MFGWQDAAGFRCSVMCAIVDLLAVELTLTKLCWTSQASVRGVQTAMYCSVCQLLLGKHVVHVLSGHKHRAYFICAAATLLAMFVAPCRPVQYTTLHCA